MAACAGGGSAPAATKTSTTTVAPSEGVIPLAEVERRTILHALEYTKGDRVMAAHLLGIGRTTLYRKLKEYGMKSSESELS
jgi:DNA-binding NtrC family response regulator